MVILTNSTKKPYNFSLTNLNASMYNETTFYKHKAIGMSYKFIPRQRRQNVRDSPHSLMSHYV